MQCCSYPMQGGFSAVFGPLLQECVNSCYAAGHAGCTVSLCCKAMGHSPRRRYAPERTMQLAGMRRQGFSKTGHLLPAVR